LHNTAQGTRACRRAEVTCDAARSRGPKHHRPAHFSARRRALEVRHDGCAAPFRVRKLIASRVACVALERTRIRCDVVAPLAGVRGEGLEEVGITARSLETCRSTLNRERRRRARRLSSPSRRTVASEACITSRAAAGVGPATDPRRTVRTPGWASSNRAVRRRRGATSGRRS
jgi:hypothetical protein